LPRLSNLESRKDAQILSGHHASNSEHISGILHNRVADYFKENTINGSIPTYSNCLLSQRMKIL
jgi:hypothetical protein